MIGYNIHDRMTYEREYSDSEKSELWRHLDAINPAPILFMDNQDWLNTALERYPNRRIAFRRWSRTDGLFHLRQQPEDIYAFYRGYDNRALIQVLNEPDGYNIDSLKAINKVIPELIKLFRRNGKKGIFINWSVGNPDEKRYDLVKDALQSIIDNDMSLGLHEYGTYRGMLWSGGNHRSDVVPYRIGRFEFINEYCLAHFGAKPTIDITEFGIDSSSYPDDDHSKKGYKSVPLSGFDYATQILEAVDKVYKNTNVKGLYLAYYGNTGKRGTAEDWYTMDVSNDVQYKAVIERHYRDQTKPPSNGKDDLRTIVSRLDSCISDLRQWIETH